LIAHGEPGETELKAIDFIVIAGIYDVSGLNNIIITDYRT
jgi:hypothetical protein